MKVSIITVCFNSAETIEDTIKSVIEQSYDNIEHIIIDGNSTDGTQDIIEKYKDNIDYYISEPDKGLYDAMNKGLIAATGDIVGILNSDDFFSQNQVISHVIENIKDVDAVYADVTFFKSPQKNKIIRYYSSREFTKKGLEKGEMPAHPSLYVKKEAYDKVGLFSLKYKIASDFDMVARLFTLPNFKWKYISEEFVKMRIGGVSTRGFKSKLQLLKEDREICNERGIKSSYFKIISKYPAKIIQFIN